MHDPSRFASKDESGSHDNKHDADNALKRRRRRKQRENKEMPQRYTGDASSIKHKTNKSTLGKSRRK